jgi:hypothetical protein
MKNIKDRPWWLEVRLMVNLPLAARPDYLCFKADGGQVFDTDEGMDGVVVVEPYYIRKSARPCWRFTTPAPWRCPHRRAICLWRNPKSADVSVLDIETGKVLAVTPVGTEPSSTTITPDDKYALILNQASGHMGDCRPLHERSPFMLIPVGSPDA